MKVSVIIPVRNSRNYVRECISNLRRQTFRDFEAIFVVDSHTDDGSEQELTGLDDLDIKVLRQDDDGRVSSARNIGFSQACGEYIWFLDVDDTPSPSFLEKMVGLLESTGSAFSACNFIYRIPGTDMPLHGGDYHVREMDGVSAINAMNLGEISPNVWDKLFRAQLIRDNGIRFEKGYSEDYHFVSESCMHSAKVVYTSEPLYCYNLNENSRSSSKGNEIATKDVEIFEKYRAVFEKDHPDMYEQFCRASMGHIIRSFTMTDWKTCKGLLGRESIRSSRKYCNLSNKEFLLFRISPRLYYMLGRYARRNRYRNRSFLFNPRL